jgi:hypothetical protein
MIELLNSAPSPHTVKLTLKDGWVRVGWHKWLKSPALAAAE